MARVIQKVRLASPETFEEVQKELQAGPLKHNPSAKGELFQEILEVELENTGSQKARIKEAGKMKLDETHESHLTKCPAEDLKVRRCVEG